MLYLVFNKNKDSRFLPYSEQFKLFRDPLQATEHARSIGWDNPFGSPWIPDKAGVMDSFACGDIEVGNLAIAEPEE
jgi:hypothetical protein